MITEALEVNDTTIAVNVEMNRLVYTKIRAEKERRRIYPIRTSWFICSALMRRIRSW